MTQSSAAESISPDGPSLPQDNPLAATGILELALRSEVVGVRRNSSPAFPPSASAASPRLRSPGFPLAGASSLADLIRPPLAVPATPAPQTLGLLLIGTQGIS